MDITKKYIERINRVIDYIELNLAGQIRLDELAHIAYSCGFNDSATFARAFRTHFKMSASEWKKKKNSKIHQDKTMKSSHIGDMKTGVTAGKEPLLVSEKYLDEIHVAYVRNTGPYARDTGLFLALYRKLMKWAKPKGIVNYPETKDIVVYHDSMDITEKEMLRISVGITAPVDTPVGGEIGKLRLAKGRYIASRFEVKNEEYDRAWACVFCNILPQLGLQPDDGFCFEHYPPNCYNKQNDTTIVDIFVPVKSI